MLDWHTNKSLILTNISISDCWKVILYVDNHFVFYSIKIILWLASHSLWIDVKFSGFRFVTFFIGIRIFRCFFMFPICNIGIYKLWFIFIAYKLSILLSVDVVWLDIASNFTIWVSQSLKICCFLLWNSSSLSKFVDVCFHNFKNK